MIAVSAQTRVLVCIGPIDFRKGIDGLAASCREILSGDPFSGADGQGFWLCQKRLSEGRFRHWPTARDSEVQRELVAHQLQVLLAGGDADAEAARGMSPWRRLPMPPM